MSPIKYGIVDETYSIDSIKRTSYVIVGYSNIDVDGTATIVISVRDVSDDKQKMLDLIELCNRLEVSDIHLYDVINDFFAE